MKVRTGCGPFVGTNSGRCSAVEQALFVTTSLAVPEDHSFGDRRDQVDAELRESLPEISRSPLLLSWWRRCPLGRCLTNLPQPSGCEARHGRFAAVWFVTSQKEGVSAQGLKDALGFGSYETAWAWLLLGRGGGARPEPRGRPCHRQARSLGDKAPITIADERDQRRRLGRMRLTLADRPGGSLDLIEFACDVIAPARAPPLAPTARKCLRGLSTGSAARTRPCNLDEFTVLFNRRTSKARGMLFYRMLRLTQLFRAPYLKPINGQH